MREFLPWAAKLLADSRPEARRYGLVCLFAVTLRRALDSEALLEPYVPDLLSIVENRAVPLRPMAMRILGNMWPRLSPKALAYLTAHLADKDNPAQDTGWMACTLLRDGSDARTHDVIAFVRKQDKPEVTVEVLKCFRAFTDATMPMFLLLSVPTSIAQTHRYAEVQLKVWADYRWWSVPRSWPS